MQETREKFRKQLRHGLLDERLIEIEIRERMSPPFEIFSNTGVEEIGIHIQEMIPGLLGESQKGER